jgi:hypothetical protein
MPRLGELLVAAGQLTSDQVLQALRAQVMWGGRIGTNLIELGFLDLDTLAQVLSRQHRLPAALARHFDKADPALQRQLSTDIAERFAVVPLVRTAPAAGGPLEKLVIASTGPIDERGVALIAAELAGTPEQVVVAVAAELRIRYHLERAYRIPRASRFLRARGKTVPPFPQFEIAAAFDDSEVGEPAPEPAPEPPPSPAPTPVAEALRALEIVESGEPGDQPISQDSSPALPTPPAPPRISLEEALAALEMLDSAVPEEIPRDESSGRERRRYVRTITDEPSTDSERQALARIAIRRVAAPSGQTLGEATRAIRRSTDRDKVADLVISAVDRFLQSCQAAAVLVVRGEVAIGWKGFSRSGATLPDIGVPLEQPGLVPRAIASGTTTRALATELGPIDQLLIVSLGYTKGELVIVPVTIAGQVMCAIALVASPEAELSGAETIAAAAGAAFARLMRNTSR